MALMLRKAIIVLSLLTCSVLASSTPSYADEPAAAVVTDSTAPAPAPAADAPDAPAVAAEPDGDDVIKLWKDGAFLPALIVGVFLALSIASKRIDWLQKGKQAALISALLTGCAVLVERAAAGTTPTLSMVLTALGSAVLLFLKPTPKATTPAA